MAVAGWRALCEGSPCGSGHNPIDPEKRSGIPKKGFILSSLYTSTYKLESFPLRIIISSISTLTTLSNLDPEIRTSAAAICLFSPALTNQPELTHKT